MHDFLDTSSRIETTSDFPNTMVNKKQPIEVSPQLFLNSLPADKHPEVEFFFQDGNVDHLVLMISEQTRQREVIPIGRLSEIKSISDLSALNADGMQAKAYVDARKSFPDLSKKLSPKKHKTWEPPKKTALNTSLEFAPPSTGEMKLQTQIETLRREMAEVRSKLILREKTIEEMQKKAEQDSLNGESASVDDTMLLDRENSVQKAEEELINRLTYLMEKEAELEQFEENLQARENALNRREQSIDKTPEAEEPPDSGGD